VKPIAEEDLDANEKTMTGRMRWALLKAADGEELWGLIHSGYALERRKLAEYVHREGKYNLWKPTDLGWRMVERLRRKRAGR